MNIFESIITIYIVLIFLILILLARISNNQDLVNENSKDKLTDKANIKNARKYFAKKKTFKILLLLAIISLLLVLISDFTSIDKEIIDYFSYNIYKEQELDKKLYLIPIFIFIIRQIILEVKIGDFLFKYYKVEEPVLEENLLKLLLYKKTPQTTQNKDTQKEQSRQESINKEESEIKKES